MKMVDCKKLVVPLITIAITLLIIGTTYAWLTLTLEGTKDQVITTGTLALVLDDTASTGITLDKAVPMLEEVAMKKMGYTFTLENTGDVDSKYTIYLDDLPLLDSEIRLEDKYIRYNIQNDQGFNKTRLFSQLKSSPNRVLDSGTIAPGKKYTYTLRVWLDYDADNGAMGKTFKGKIRVEAQQDIEYLPATLIRTTWSNDLQTTTGHFWDYKANVTKVVLETEKKKPVGVVQEWDVSTTNDGTVMAYLTGEEVAGYTLYLQANGPIKANVDSDNLFQKFVRLQTIEGLENLDTSQATSMNGMFWNCSSLTTLDLSSFDTLNVTDMSKMFYGCSSFITLDLSSFATSNVTTMSTMFRDCSSLTTLDLSSFATSNVKYMSDVFFGCSNLAVLDLSSFDTSSVIDMGYMFYNCESLTTLDLSSFDTSLVTDMYGMFTRCSSLTTLDLSHFNTSNVTIMRMMFYGCTNLTTLDISSFNTSNVTTMRYMFTDCKKLSILDISHFDTGKVVDMEYMFNRCSSLTTLDLSSFNTSNVTIMRGMFNNCSGLTTLDLSSFDTSKVVNMEEMFYNCRNLTKLDISNFDIANVTVMDNMFSSISSSAQILVKDIATQTWVIAQNSNFSTSNVLLASA